MLLADLDLSSPQASSGWPLASRYHGSDEHGVCLAWRIMSCHSCMELTDSALQW